MVAELVDAVELVRVVSLGAFLDENGGLMQRPAVERVHLGHRHGVLGGVEVEQVGELEAERVAEKTVGFADVFQDFLVDWDVVAKILRGDPEADDIRAVLRDVGVGRLRLLVGRALGNLLAVLVDDEAVGEDGLVGRRAKGDDAIPEGRLEPAAMLVTALEIEVGWPRCAALAALEDSGLGRTRVEPHVERVAPAGQRLGRGPVGRQLDALEDAGGADLVPEIGALGGDLVRDGADDAGIEVGLLVRAVESDDRHAPRALAADAPVRARLDGAADAGLAPGGDPTLILRDLGDLVEGDLAVTGLVQGNEPLVDGAEDDGRLGAPAMGVAVLVLGLGEQRVGLGELLEHAEVGGRGLLGGEILDSLQRGQADEIGGHAAVVEVFAVVADRAVDLEAVLESGLVILRAVTRRGVHGAGAAVGGDVVSQHDGRGAVDERMAGLQLLEFGAGDREDDGGLRVDLGGGDDCAEQRRGDDDAFRAGVGDGVLDLGMQRDCEVGGNRPGGGRPDDEIQRLVGRQTEFRGFLDRHEELHPDGDRGVVLVLDLGLGEGGLEGDRPVNGLLAAVDEALFDERGERAQDVGFEGRGLRLVLVLPIREHADALELTRLLGDPAFGEFVALGAELGGRERQVLLLDVLADLLLDRQAVAVPARDVRRAEAAHRLVAVDEVLERLVQRRADVDVAVGERRAVMEHEGGPAGAGSLDFAVKIELFPVGDAPRFAFHEIRPHGEIGLGQQQGIFQVLRHGNKAPEASPGRPGSKCQVAPFGWEQVSGPQAVGAALARSSHPKD